MTEQRNQAPDQGQTHEPQWYAGYHGDMHNIHRCSCGLTFGEIGLPNDLDAHKRLVA